MSENTLAIVELGFQLILMTSAYAIGVGIAFLLLKLVNMPFSHNYAGYLVLVLPVVTCVLAEYFTELWMGTPGSMGLGGLNVVLPMLLSGIVIMFAASTMQQFVEPYTHHFARGDATLTPWLVLALTANVFSVALWRYWPEPTAKLW
ncbi:MAG: hypothetical protein RLN89_08125 [Parvibaculum sp.]